MFASVVNLFNAEIALRVVQAHVHYRLGIWIKIYVASEVALQPSRQRLGCLGSNLWLQRFKTLLLLWSLPLRRVVQDNLLVGFRIGSQVGLLRQDSWPMAFLWALFFGLLLDLCLNHRHFTLLTPVPFSCVAYLRGWSWIYSLRYDQGCHISWTLFLCLLHLLARIYLVNVLHQLISTRSVDILRGYLVLYLFLLSSLRLRDGLWAMLVKQIPCHRLVWNVNRSFFGHQKRILPLCSLWKMPRVILVITSHQISIVAERRHSLRVLLVLPQPLSQYLANALSAVLWSSGSSMIGIFNKVVSWVRSVG